MDINRCGRLDVAVITELEPSFVWLVDVSACDRMHCDLQTIYLQCESQELLQILLIPDIISLFIIVLNSTLLCKSAIKLNPLLLYIQTFPLNS